MKSFLAAALWLAVALLALATLAALAGALHWTALLATHFRPHLALAALLLLSASLWLGRRRAALLLAVTLIANGWFVAAAALRTAPVAGAGGTLLRVMTFNIGYANRDYAALEAAIMAVDPDLLLLSEVLPHHAPLLQALAAHYPYRALPGAEGSQGEALYSRHALGTALRHRAGESASLWEVDLRLEGRSLLVYGGHPLPAMNADLDRVQRDWYLLTAATLAARPAGRPMLLLGDLNATPWSPRLLELLQVADLRWSGYWLGTWPSVLPGWAGLPIDQILSSPEVAVAATFVGQAAGSDHRPLIADLRLP